MRSSDPSSQFRGRFDVFLSFRGPDVRKNFLGHLHDALIHERIRAYIDSEDLQRGHEIAPALMKAIEDSRIAIIVVSENYTSSGWCLDELAKIIDCMKQDKLVVKAVFYREELKELWTPEYSFAKELAPHELKLGKDSNRVKRWRDALYEARHLSGWTLHANGNEAELIKKIVKDVNIELDDMQLDRKHLDVAQYPVGIESRVREIKKLLNMESDKVLLVGLWGMAGIGKTTLAKAICNDVANQFDGRAFLLNVREESASPSGIAKLQEKLLSQMLGRNDEMILSTDIGKTLIKERLNRKKVLLLLDDISNTDQLEALAERLNWFGSGSRILVTTRDKSLLMAYVEHTVHKVEGLPDNQALQLLCKHAFLGIDRPNIAEDLRNKCLAYCDGLPLALVVLGSSLQNLEKCHWGSQLNMLEQDPCEKIDKVLRVGFDELDFNSKEILHHIAWFFNGMRRREVEIALDISGFKTSHGIEMLIERSLITIVEDTSCGSSVERVEMHPLIMRHCRKLPRGKFPFLFDGLLPVLPVSVRTLRCPSTVA